ncbi:MAG: phage tail assembly protein [Chloroflexi bacterium]|nr:phage tail assembly protein [Chloroflexota bacterium]
MTLHTEFEFVLPIGYVDEYGQVHKTGTMRLATAADEIAPLRDPRVRSNEAYLVVLLLAQVITRLGALPRVTPEMIERFFAADVAYLQDFYRRINEVEMNIIRVACPRCGHDFHVEIPLLED